MVAKVSKKGCVRLLKERLDVLLVDRGIYPSRERAKSAIMAGLVFVDQQLSDKPGTTIDPKANIEIKEDICPFVSKGGLKLEKALDCFEIELKDKIAMDIGASTGGFTDCMLQHGTNRVYAIDVGYGQLDWKLRNDPRVVNLEKVNVRYLDPGAIPEQVDFISIDVSFISLRLVLPIAYRSLREDGQLVCLVKPQFEAGREQVGKNGIVRDRAIHQDVLRKVTQYGKESGFVSCQLTFSPRTGAKGNIEFLLLLRKNGQNELSEHQITAVVTEAHLALAK